MLNALTTIFLIFLKTDKKDEGNSLKKLIRNIFQEVPINTKED